MSGLLCWCLSGSRQTRTARRSDAPPGRRVGGDVGSSNEGPSARTRGGGLGRSKIQSICNAKCDGNYNAKPCGAGRKAAGAGTMACNGKNNAREQSKQSEIRTRALSPAVTPQDRQRRRAPSRCQVDRVCCGIADKSARATPRLEFLHDTSGQRTQQRNHVLAATGTAAGRL